MAPTWLPFNAATFLVNSEFITVYGACLHPFACLQFPHPFPETLNCKHSEIEGSSFSPVLSWPTAPIYTIRTYIHSLLNYYHQTTPHHLLFVELLQLIRTGYKILQIDLYDIWEGEGWAFLALYHSFIISCFIDFPAASSSSPTTQKKSLFFFHLKHTSSLVALVLLGLIFEAKQANGVVAYWIGFCISRLIH